METDGNKISDLKKKQKKTNFCNETDGIYSAI